MRKLLLATVATALSVAGTASATPQTRYFDCGGQTPVTNVSEPSLTWSETAPPKALQDGSGCLGLDYIDDAKFGGTYGGEVSQIELRLYSVLSNPLYLPDTYDLAIDVDGETVYSEAEVVGDVSQSGSKPFDYVTTWTIRDLFIPESATPKQITITVTDPYSDDFAVWGRGASDMPSGVTLYSHLDLPDEDPDGDG